MLRVRESSLGAEEVHSDLTSKNSRESVDERDSRDNRDNDEPKPQEDVDLLIDDVEGEDTEPVVVDDIPGRSVLVEGTLGNFGEDLGHRIHSFIGILLSEGEDLTPIGRELIAQEHVHEENLPDHIDKVEELTEEEAEGVKVVILDIGDEVVENEFLPPALVVLIYDGRVEVHDQHFDTTPFPRLPEVAWDVEEHGLEEEDEADPLVVLVVLYLVRLTRHARDPGMWDYGADF